MGRPRKHAEGCTFSVWADRREMAALKDAGFGPTTVFEFGVAVVQRLLMLSGKLDAADVVVPALKVRDGNLVDAARLLAVPGALNEIVDETLRQRRIEKELRGELELENQDEESLDQPELEAQAEIEGVLGPLLSYGVARDIQNSIVAVTNAEGCVDPGMLWYDAAEALLVETAGSGEGLLDYTCDDVIAVMRRLIRDRIQAEHGTLESEPLGAL